LFRLLIRSRSRNPRENLWPTGGRLAQTAHAACSRGGERLGAVKKKNYSYYTEMNDEALHYAMIGEHPKEKQQAIE
jgi:hypothetical protein